MTHPIPGADATRISTLNELIRSGASEQSIRLALQLLGAPVCDECDYVKQHCRCAAAKVGANVAAKELADLWIHEDMDRDATEVVASLPRGKLKVEYKDARESMMMWRRRALGAESRIAAGAPAPIGANVAADDLPVVAWLIDSYDRYDKLHQSVELSPLADNVMDDSSEAEPLCTVASAKAAIARLAAGAPDRERSPYVLGVKPSNWAEQVAAGAPAETPDPIYQVELDQSFNSWMHVDAKEVPTWERKHFKVRTVYAAQPAPIAPTETPRPCNCLQGQCCPVCDPDVCSPAPAETPKPDARRGLGPSCTCPSGDGSLRWPCPVHPK